MNPSDTWDGFISKDDAIVGNGIIKTGGISTQEQTKRFASTGMGDG